MGAPALWWLTETAVKVLWSGVTLVGSRRLRPLFPAHYRSTKFFFGGIGDVVALTIDDGLSRNGARASLVPEVRRLLAKHNARATFFVCSRYLVDVEDEAGGLISDGHELGNHMGEDRQFYYPKLPAREFAAQMRAVTNAIEALPGAPAVRWFRAPQGMLSKDMSTAVEAQGLKHALGDVCMRRWGSNP